MGGTLALAADAGHRVVLVFATRGDLGEVDDGVLEADEALGRPARATRRARAADGARRQRASSSSATATRAWSASRPTTAERRSAPPTSTRPRARLAAILARSDAEVVTAYDERGGYGHPDHIQVHRVGRRAAELAGTPRVLRGDGEPGALPRAWPTHADEMPDGVDVPDPEEIDLGVPDETHHDDRRRRRACIDRKRAAMAAHPSQIGDDSFFLALDDDAFRAVFGTEWFIRLDEHAGRRPRPGCSTSFSPERGSDSLRAVACGRKVGRAVAQRAVRRPRRVRRHHEARRGRRAPAS